MDHGTKTKRRGRNEGSLFQRADGKWVASVSTGYGADGRRRVVRKYAKDKRTAQKHLEALKARHLAGQLLEPSSATVHELVTTWLRDVVTERVEPWTLEGYSGLYDRHIKPLLGPAIVQNLTPQHISSWLSRLTAQGTGTVSRRKALNVLRQALDHARLLGLIARNPVAGVKPPKVQARIRTFLTPGQVEKYLAHLQGARLETLVLLAIVTSMREGELLGLQWGDVDVTERAIFARHALKRGKKAKGGKHKANAYYLGEISKSAASRRRIDLPVFAIDALEKHRRAMLKEGHGSMFVFCQENGGPIHPSNLRERFHYPMLEAAGLPRITFHDLRHTAATMLLSLGVHPKIVQERMGHKQIKMTMDLYSHVMPSMGREAADRLHARFGKVDTQVDTDRAKRPTSTTKKPRF